MGIFPDSEFENEIIEKCNSKEVQDAYANTMNRIITATLHRDADKIRNAARIFIRKHSPFIQTLNPATLKNDPYEFKIFDVSKLVKFAIKIDTLIHTDGVGSVEEASRNYMRGYLTGWKVTIGKAIDIIDNKVIPRYLYEGVVVGTLGSMLACLLTWEHTMTDDQLLNGMLTNILLASNAKQYTDGSSCISVSWFSTHHMTCRASAKTSKKILHRVQC